MREGKPQADEGDRRVTHDLGRVEPTLALATIEHELQRGDGDGEIGEAEDIKAAPSAVPHVRNEREDAQQRQRPERQVDVETPTP